MFVWHQLLDNDRQAVPGDSQTGSLLGPSFTDQQIRDFLDSVGAKYETIDDEQALVDSVAEHLAAEKVVGWFQGRMEFGPRALGSRSIIGDARSEQMQSTMNLKIKFRESFRPFAPSVLAERANEYFEMDPATDSPYMLLVAPLAQARRLPVDTDAAGLKGLDRLKVKRSTVPGITHVDYSARVQTVDAERNGRYYRLLEQFSQRTGCPLIINTSFNVRGEPIVCTPADAYRCFMATNMDVLVLEKQVLRKGDQPDAAQHKVDEYMAKFELD
jgi:carbamoyltransferase